MLLVFFQYKSYQNIREAVIKKKSLEFSKRGGGDPISNLFLNCLIHPEIQWKKIPLYKDIMEKLKYGPNLAKIWP